MMVRFLSLLLIAAGMALSASAANAAAEARRPTAHTDSASSTNPANAYDGNTGTAAVVPTSTDKDPAIVFHTWQSTTETYSALTLKVQYSAVAAADDKYSIAYSTNGGSSWTTLVAYTNAAATNTIASAVLNAAQDLSQLQVKVLADRVGGSDNKNVSIEEVWTDAVYTPSDTDGNLTAAAGVTEPVAISSVADTAGERVAVFDFTISDGGTSDGLALAVSQIVLHTSGTGTPGDVTWQLNGPDATYVTGTVGAGTITFSSLSISVANAGSETYTVYAYFSAAPASTDGQTFILSVDGDTDVTRSSGTRFGSTSAVTNGTGSTMNVVHSELRFRTQPPATAFTGQDFTGSVVVAGTDANGNVDIGFAENITLSAVKDADKTAGTGSLSSADAGGLTKAPTAGVATWSDVRYSAAEVIDVHAVSASYAVGINSSAVTITDPPPFTLEQSATAAHLYNAGATTITATLDATATADNLLVTAIGTDKSAGSYTAPNGFTLIQSSVGTSISGAIAYKISDGTESAVTWTTGAGEESTVWVGEYSGLDPIAPLDVSQEADSAEISVNSQTTGTTAATAQDDELAIAMVAIDSMNSVSNPSWNNGFSAIGYYGDTFSAGLGVASKELTATGTQATTFSWTGTADQAYAAIATFKVTTGNLLFTAAGNQTFTQGDNATAISAMTVRDAATPTITAADDIRIRIPAGFNMTWLTSDTTATITGTGSGKVSTSVSYEDGGQTLVINVTSDFAASDQIVVSGLSFTNFTGASSADNLELITAGSGGAVAATCNRTIAVTGLAVTVASLGQSPHEQAGETEVLAMASIVSTGSSSVSAFTFTEGGTIDGAAELSNLKLWLSDDMILDGSDVQLGATGSFNADNGTVSFNEDLTITTGQKYLMLQGAIGASNTAGDTIEIELTSVTSGSTISGTPLTFSGTTTVLASGFFNASWSYRKRIRFNNSSQSTDITSVPILVKLNSTVIDYGQVSNASGYDLRFVDSNNSDVLSYHIESWNTSGDSIIWLKVPQINAASALDYVWIYYGNAAINTSSENENDVFSNGYEAVYHFDETSGQYSDSTANAHNSSALNVVSRTNTKFGNAPSFNGTATYYIRIPDSNGFDLTSWTIEAWVNSAGAGVTADTGTGGRTVYPICSKGKGEAEAQAQDIHWILGQNDTGTAAIDYENLGSSANVPLDSTTTLTSNGSTWYYISAVMDNPNDDYRMHVNGVLERQITTTSSPNTGGSQDVGIATAYLTNGTTGGAFNGTIDEVRISSVPRSADWVKVQYLSGANTLNMFEGVTAGITVDNAVNQPNTLAVGAQDQVLGVAAVARSVGTGTVTAVTIKDNSGTADAENELSNVELWLSDDVSWDAGDEQLAAAQEFNGVDGEITFTETFSVTTASKYLIVRADVEASAVSGHTVELQFLSFATADTVQGLPLNVAGTTTLTNNTLASFQDGVSPTAGYAGTADTHISDQAKTTNYGNANPLNIDGDAPETTILLKWDISSIPSNATVSDVKIVLTNQSDASDEYEIYECLRNWAEDQATWNVYSTGNSWQVAGSTGALDSGSEVLGSIIFGNNPGSQATFTLNASGVSTVQAWVSGTRPNYGFCIRDYTNVNGGDFYSSESATATQRPKLEVTYSTSGAPAGRRVIFIN